MGGISAYAIPEILPEVSGLSQENDLITLMAITQFGHRFVLWPHRWNTLQLDCTLDWKLVPFSEASAEQLPDEFGVYAFLIQPQIASLNLTYLMYVGKTDRTFRERFREYLRERDSGKIRPKLLKILPQYPDHLFFAYAAAPSGYSPADLETALLHAFVPPGNDQLDAEFTRADKAFL